MTEPKPAANFLASVSEGAVNRHIGPLYEQEEGLTGTQTAKALLGVGIEKQSSLAVSKVGSLS